MHCLEIGQILISTIKDVLRTSVDFTSFINVLSSKYHLDTVVIIHRMHGELNASSE